MSKNTGLDFGAGLPPSEIIAISRRKLSVQIWLLNKQLKNINQQLKDLERYPQGKYPGGFSETEEVLSEMASAMSGCWLKIFNELGSIRKTINVVLANRKRNSEQELGKEHRPL